jgi:hypothetical protein
MIAAFTVLFIIGLVVLRWGLKESKDEAGRGAVLSVIGFLLLLPSLGKYMWDLEQEKKRAPHLANSEDDGAQAELFNRLSFLDRQLRLLAKQDVQTKLNSKLALWYHSLEDRRQKLGSVSNAEVLKFNEEAAAYVALRAVAGEQAEEIKKLQGK